MPKLVKRSEMRNYMNTGTSANPVWTLIGEGFSSVSTSMNAKEYTRQYVHESTERTDIVGYAPSTAYSLDTYTDNPVIKKIRDITDGELLGTDAQVEILQVFHFEGSASARPATKRVYAVIPDALGDGTDALIYTGNFKPVSDATRGTFNENLAAFTGTAGDAVYRVVTPSSGDNPMALGWYESDGGTGYVLTDDTTVNNEATYYAKF